MQLDRETGNGNIIRSFSAGELLINNESYGSPVIVSAETIIDWSPASLDSLSIADFAAAISQKPEVILFGSGIAQHFPPMTVITEIMRAGIGFEAMDTSAACRTFNVLAGEHRKVVAALLVR
ncbi:MAG: Mth938-like domain-containing protein [Gammaproteobacteria bacterium]|nr:Mth938-like domain-containing protein [Gammaproteobacteria bacterium]